MAVAGVIPVFRPTLAEMADFPAYISFMESQGAHNIGLAKVGCLQPLTAMQTSAQRLHHEWHRRKKTATTQCASSCCSSSTLLAFFSFFSGSRCFDLDPPPQCRQRH